MSLALVGGTVIDGNAGAPIKNATVLIEGERIVEIGAKVALPPGARRLDVTGKTIMPGLIDGHTHISGEFNPNAGVPLQGLPEYGAIRGVVSARRMLDAGFTAARAMAGANYTNVALKLAIDQGLVPGPRLVSAGPMVRTVGASGQWSPPAAYPETPDSIFSGADGARKAVRLQHAFGVDFVETTVSGLVGSSNGTTPIDMTNWSLEEMQAAVDESHQLGHRIGANCYVDESVQLCVKAGFDIIEHGCMITDRGIEALAKAGTYIVPTLCAYNAYVAPDAERSYPTWRLNTGRRVEKVLREWFKKYLAGGAKVFGGSDGSGPGTGRRPGEGALELELMVEYGLSPMQAIVANTKTVAEAMGWEENIGTLEKGKFADLLVVDGDPIADIKILKDIKKIILVMKGGSIHRSDLGEARN